MYSLRSFNTVIEVETNTQRPKQTDVDLVSGVPAEEYQWQQASTYILMGPRMEISLNCTVDCRCRVYVHASLKN